MYVRMVSRVELNREPKLCRVKRQTNVTDQSVCADSAFDKTSIGWPGCALQRESLRLYRSKFSDGFCTRNGNLKGSDAKST